MISLAILIWLAMFILSITFLLVLRDWEISDREIEELNKRLEDCTK